MTRKVARDALKMNASHHRTSCLRTPSPRAGRHSGALLLLLPPFSTRPESLVQLEHQLASYDGPSRDRSPCEPPPRGRQQVSTSSLPLCVSYLTPFDLHRRRDSGKRVLVGEHPCRRILQTGR